MYDKLKTNVPRRMIEFKDFEFDETYPEFMPADQFLKYMTAYTEKF